MQQLLLMERHRMHFAHIKESGITCESAGSRVEFLPLGRMRGWLGTAPVSMWCSSTPQDHMSAASLSALAGSADTCSRHRSCSSDTPFHNAA